MSMKLKWALALSLALIGVCAMGIANATDLKLTCTPPTQNTDGTAITGAITYNLYGGKSGESKQKLATAATACNFTRTNVSVGTQEYYVTAVVNNVESAPSNTASIVVQPPTPNAPTSVVVTVTVAVTP